MKKLIVIFLSVIVIIIFSYSNTDKHIKVNKVYTKNINLAQDNNNITIDNTRIMEKTKEILNDIYKMEDFSEFRIQSDFADDDVFYIYFFYNDYSGYFISYNIDEGVVIMLSKLHDDDQAADSEVKPLDELKEIIMGYLNKLEVSDSDNYEISSYEYYSRYLDAKLTNKLTQKEIRINIDLYTGELLEYDYSSIIDMVN